MISNGTAWQKITNSAAVSSVAGKTGVVTLTTADLTDVNLTGNAAGKVLTWDGSQWAPASTGAGSVSSVHVSGGSTGLTTSGGPITSSGTITLEGTLAITNGGTGAGTADDARTNLGLGTAAVANTGTSATNIPVLDGTGKIPNDLLNFSGLAYKGNYSLSGNPTVPVETSGNYYIISEAGTETGSALTFAAGDWMISNGAAWQKITNSSAVSSVAGKTGAVLLSGADITSGTVAVAYGGTGTATGSITGTGALTFAAGGINQNVALTPSGTGNTLLSGKVGIGTASPDPSAKLEVSSTTQGTLITRMTTAQRDAIASPVESLFIYNTTTHCFEAFVNGAWNSVSCPSACTPPAACTASSASGIGCRSFTANWSASTGATSYFIDVATNSGFSAFVTGYINLNVGNMTSYSITNLTPGTTYYYRLRAATACVSGNSNMITVTTNPVPVQPSVITETATLCQGASAVAYSVTNVAGVTYAWSYSGTGMTGISGTTNAISPTFSALATSGTLSVTPNNTCGSGTARTFAITVNSVPAQPGAVTGTSPVCQGSNGVAYSVTNVAGVSYAWTYSGTGFSIASGSGTNSITANFSASATSGTLTVTPSNSCGNGTAQTYPITINSVPAQPSVITGTAANCPGTNAVAYSVTNVAGVSYAWTYSGTGFTVASGSGTNAITADFSALATSGTLTVTPSNTCGNGTARTQALTIYGVPAAPTAGSHSPASGQIVWN